MSIQRFSSDTATSSSHWKYDVFLSFRGEDTRRNFTDHLNAALTREGIIVFKDDVELQRGNPISLELLQAIEESRFSIIVFSRNYASSTWCLDEIAKIVECKNMRGQHVVPLFYDVDPYVVRKQTGTFQEPFAKYEEIFNENKEKVQIWRNALKDVANLSGWDAKDRHESELIHDIVKDISFRLSPTTLMTFEGLVGMKNRLEELRLRIGTRSNDIRMIGICGMGGIGKTTIARVFYNLFSCQFEGSVFLANVRENSKRSGLITLQSQLLLKIVGRENIILDEYDGINEIKRRLRAKNVLVVVDDVDHIEQLNKLVGNHDWFGFGSRIIITTRDKHLLKIHGVDEVYDAKVLNHDEALQLFILKAFKNQQPLEDYLKLSKLVVKYVNGLPLALEVLGSFFYGRTIDEWMDTIKRLKRDSNKEILDKLQISFDGLEETEKKIFLDVACFFKRKSREYVTRILDGCGFNPTIGISVLLDKSLITISNLNELGMHDLLQEMGRQIVKKECIEEPGKRSRLWDEEDIRHVLEKNTGTEHVEAIVLEKELNVSASAKVFSRMINLRLLKIRNVLLPKGLEYLSEELRLLDWVGFPLKSLPSNLQLNKIVELKMDGSCIKQLPEGNKPSNMLTSISFRDCKSLIKIPDFTGIPNLESLNLGGCSRLCEIHPSLLVHKKIERMDLSDCSSLKTLPSQIHMECLRELWLSGCSELENFPEIIGSMECLWMLKLCGTAIKELPVSIGRLSRLVYLSLLGCKNLSSLPNTVSGLESLQHLFLSGCSELESMPETLGQVKGLRRISVKKLIFKRLVTKELLSPIFSMSNLLNLRISGCKGSPSKSIFKRRSNPLALILPSLPSNLSHLETLDLSDCNLGEGAITSDFLGSFISLRHLDLSENNFVSLPGGINRLSKLISLKLNYCRMLESLPELPSNVGGLEVNGCVSLETLSNALRLCISNLFQIQLEYCLKLSDSGEAFSIMKEHLKVTNKKTLGFEMIATGGSEVPEWFKHKSDGNSIIIEKLPDFNNNSPKLLGYVVCSLFSAHKTFCAHLHFSFRESHCMTIPTARFDGTSVYDSFSHNDPIQTSSNLSKLFLRYLPIETDDDTMETYYDTTETFYDCEFSIETNPGEEMLGFGVYPVYENEDFC